MDACEDVKPNLEVKAWRTPSTPWTPLLKVKTTVCLLLQLQTRLKNYKGNGENMPGAIVSLFGLSSNISGTGTVSWRHRD